MVSQTTSHVKIGISACLLGDQVRYDGGHKKNAFAVDKLGPLVEFVRVCPELELGLGVPREPIRLVQEEELVRLKTSTTSKDLTDRMAAYAKKRIEQLKEMDLDGFVLKKDSPSCGMERVKVHMDNGHNRKVGRGVFADILIREMPLLPVEEEGRLCDPVLRENFMQRVFAYRRLRQVFRNGWLPSELVRFHSTEKLLLHAHDPNRCRALGRIVSQVKHTSRRTVAEEYQALFMETLALRATPRRHCNVLQRMVGYFRNSLSDEQFAEISELIDDFKQQLVPLVAPVTLLNHYVHRFNVDYLRQQSYLSPVPKQLMCRNYTLSQSA